MLLCLGDSITAQPHAWPLHLPPEDVEVRAVSGATIRDTLPQVRALPADASAAVLSVGVNDVLQLGQPLDVDALGDLLEPLTATGMRVALLDVFLFMPLHPPRHWRELSARRAQARAALRAGPAAILRPRLGPRCWARDGIHPNERGQRVIAHTVTDWLGR